MSAATAPANVRCPHGPYLSLRLSPWGTGVGAHAQNREIKWGRANRSRLKKVTLFAPD